MGSQGQWIYPHTFGFRKKGVPWTRRPYFPCIELHKIQRKRLHGFGLYYIKCFDLIPQAIVMHIALEQGMDPCTHKAMSGMYNTLTRYFEILGCCASFFAATNGIVQGCPRSVSLINLMNSVWKLVLDAQPRGITVLANMPPPSNQPAYAL